MTGPDDESLRSGNGDADDEATFPDGPGDPSLYTKGAIRRHAWSARRHGCVTSLAALGVIGGAILWVAQSHQGARSARWVVVIGLFGWMLLMKGAVQVATGAFWNEMTPNKRAGVMALLGVALIAGLIGMLAILARS